MKRIIDTYFLDWKKQSDRKALLVRGARQVGKTYSVRALGKTFDEYVEINLEMRADVAKVFDYNLDPSRILRELRLLTGKKLVPGKSLLFFDEVQEHPEVVTALRYFYELIPELHVVAAGSLMEFGLDKIGLPVGRVTSLHMSPMSFLEFLAARDQFAMAAFILDPDTLSATSSAIHEQLMRLLGEYLVVGGLPEVVSRWADTQDLGQCQDLLDVIATGYRQDFQRYAKRHQVKYVDLVFSEIPGLIGRKFKYSALPGSWKSRELAPAIELLCKAGVMHRVTQSAGNALPLKAESKPDRFKPLFLDIGLAQRVMSADVRPWLVDPTTTISNVGAVVEAFVGQELLAYANPKTRAELFYWHRESRSSNAEVDYLLPLDSIIFPIEVKAGSTGSLRSMAQFLAEKPQVPHGIRLWGALPNTDSSLQSLPLYAVAHLVRDSLPDGLWNI